MIFRALTESHDRSAAVQFLLLVCVVGDCLPGCRHICRYPCPGWARLGVMGTTTLLVVLNLLVCSGYTSFGWAADQFGRRKAFNGV